MCYHLAVVGLGEGWLGSCRDSDILVQKFIHAHLFYKIWCALCNVLKFKNLYDFHSKRSKKLTIVFFHYLTIYVDFCSWSC